MPRITPTPDPDECPDCGEYGMHTRTCPLARGLRAVSDADGYWFRRFPYMAWRTRPVADAELREMRWRGVEPPEDAHILVTNIAPGVRRRTLILLADTDAA